jgi:activator of the mannose operon (transcriptional antiterminator)
MSEKDRNIKEIMAMLIKSEMPMTTKQFSSVLAVSEKTVRNYLKEVEEKFLSFGIELNKKPHIGTFIEASQEERALLKRNFYLEESNPYSSEYRQEYILKILLKNRYTYTIQLLVEDLCCSKNTIVKDLIHVQNWLEHRELCLKRKPNQGLWVEGSENAVRDAMMSLFSKAKNEEDERDLIFDEIENLDYRIDLVNYKKIKNFFPNLKFFKVQSIIQESEEKLGYYFTDQAFINLIAHIAIALERVKFDKRIEMKNNYYEFVKENKEYTIAQWVVEELSKAFNLEIPQGESAYICLHMLGSKIQEEVKINKNYSRLIHAQEGPHVEIAKEIIHLVGEVIGVDLSQDELLLASLVIHLRPTIIRLKYGLNLRNPLLQRIKKEFVNIFGATWASNSIFEKRFGLSINEDEVAYITLHIAVAVERLQNKIKAIVICSSGIGTSQMVANRLKKKLPHLDILAIIPLRLFTDKMLAENDLIISTVPIVQNNNKIVYVSTFVDEKDIQLIENSLHRPKVAQLENVPIEAKRNSYFSNIISLDYCFFDEGDTTYMAIIKKYGMIMQEAGLVYAGFYENIIEREQKASTIIGKGIAIPHAKEELVISSKITIIKLENSVVWKGHKIDIIFILALKFDDVQSTKLFFKNFYALLDNEEVIQQIKKSNDKEKIVSLFLNPAE